jgi:hypothetical protein
MNEIERQLNLFQSQREIERVSAGDGKLQSNDPRWLAWRRYALEERLERPIFNVPRQHGCWQGEDASIKPLQHIESTYGCYRCGRVHQCFRSTDSCPVKVNERQEYVCAFSGLLVAPPDFVIGVYDLEIAAKTAANLRENEENMHANFATSKSIQLSANFSQGTTRRRRLVLADASSELEHAQREATKFARILRAHEKKTKEHEKRRTQIRLMGDDEEPQSLVVTSVPQETETLAEDDPKEGKESGSGDLVAFDPLYASLRTQFMTPEDASRDCDYQSRFFARLEEALLPFASDFQPRKFTPSPMGDSVLSQPTPKKRTRTHPSILQDRARCESMSRLRNITHTLLSLIDALVSNEEPPHDLGPIPVLEKRVQVYTLTIASIIELTLRKPLRLISENEYVKHASTLLLDALGEAFQDRDSEGDLLYIWATDPCVAWYRSLALARRVTDFQRWDNIASKPHLAKLCVSRKRRRSDASNVTQSPLNEQATAQMRALDSKFRETFVHVAHNISHQSNALREAIHVQRLGPMAAFARAHWYLLHPPPS